MKLNPRKVLKEFLVGAGVFSAACGYMFGIPALCKSVFPEEGMFIGVMFVLSPLLVFILCLLGNVVIGIYEGLHEKNTED